MCQKFEIGLRKNGFYAIWVKRRVPSENTERKLWFSAVDQGSAGAVIRLPGYQKNFDSSHQW